MIRPFFAMALLVVCAALLPTPAQAWGPLGHRLVARLAEPQLSPQARAEVKRLLASGHFRSLPDIANWADELRERDPDLGRRTAKWHYVNIGEHDCAFDARRDCPNGDCVVEAIRAQAAILANRGKSDAERLQALKFVVHLVGDVHQPMHAGFARDRGGNNVQIQYRGRGSNLHALWDSALLGSRGLGETTYGWRLRVPAIDATLPEHAFSAVAPAQWAEQSCRIVVQPRIYPARARVDDDYVAAHRPIAERQVKLAGARLAALLNDVLG